MSDRFSGKVAIVAGGTGGLGRAVSLAFLEEGAHVVVTYRAQTEWDSLRAIGGPNLSGRFVDVTNESEVVSFAQEIAAQYGRIDALVNAVGGYAGGTKLWETDPQVLDRLLALNLRSGWTLARSVVPVMLQQGSGAIVNVASAAAFDHAAGAAAYAATKAAAVAMIDSLAADLKGSGVRANSILPNIIDTEANRKAMPGADFSKWPKPEDIARVILFLCSDGARLVHGAAVPVYGNG
jgi:NAD(P)-dependent dehydrogenase (short-subunit alcohol dehydrogenase family)